MSTKLGTLTLDLVARIGSFTQGMRDASASAEREMGRAGNSVNTMDGLLKKLAVTAGTVFSISQIANYADSYTGMVNKMKLVTEGQTQLSIAMTDTHKIAQATASDWSSVVDVYTKFQKISDRLGLSQSEVARITETVTKAVGISGASADEAQRSLVQFSQALSLGVLRGQDLNSVMQQTPGLTDAIAKGMGVTSDKLKQMGSDGVLTTQKVVEALQKVAGSIDADYAETATLIASSFSLVKNEAIKMIGEFDQAHGISQTFVQGMTSVADNLEDITRVMAIAGAYMVGTYIPMIIKGTYATVSDTAAKVANIVALRAKAIADYDVAKSNLAATAAMARAMGATNAQTAAMMANARAAYQQAAAAKAAALSGASLSSALLGPVGVGIALASVATGFLFMSDSAKESTKSLRENNIAVGDAVKAYQELNAVQQAGQLVAEKEKLEELENAYRQASTALDVYASGMASSNDFVTESQIELSKLLAEYKKTGNLELFIATVQKSSKVSQSAKDDVASLASKVDVAGNAAKTQKDFILQLNTSINGTADQAKKSAVEVAGLTEELKKLFDQANQNIKNSQITTALAKHGYSDEMIALAQKYMAVQGAVVKNEQGLWRLRPDVQKQFNEEWIALQKQKSALDVRNDAEKARTKELEKQAKLIKASTIDAVISSGEGNYNSVNLGQKGGYKASTRNLTSMTVAQVLSAQKAKEFNAAGKYQTINSTLQAAVDAGVVSSAEKFSEEVQERIFKQYLVALKRPEIKGFITGNTSASLNDALLGTAKEFASVANPSTGKSYYAGQGNNKASISAEKMTESLLAQQKVYRENIALGMSSEQAWLKSFNTSATVTKTGEVDLDKFLEDMIKRKQDQAQKQKEIQVQYYDDLQKLEFDNQEKIKEIQESFANDPKERDRLIELQAKAYEVDMGNWLKAQDERIDAENEANKQIVLSRKAAFEEMNAAAAEMNRIGLEAKARASMTPYQYNEWRAGNEQQSSYSELADSFYSARNGIENNEYLLESEKNAQLLEVHEQYLEAKAALDDEYAQRERDLNQARYEDQLGLYGSLLSQASSVWGSMTDMVRESKGEQSKTYKAMFLAQQAIAIGQQIINTELAAMQPMAQMGIYGIPASMLIRGMGYASVGVIAAQTVAGMAHDGIDNIPKEGTWLLDKGERVVDKRTNGDLKDFIAKGANGGVTVNVNVPVGYIGKQSTDAEGNVTIDVVKREILNSWSNLGRANSHESRQLESYGVSRTR